MVNFADCSVLNAATPANARNAAPTFAVGETATGVPARDDKVRTVSGWAVSVESAVGTLAVRVGGKRVCRNRSGSYGIWLRCESGECCGDLGCGSWQQAEQIRFVRYLAAL